jgi:isocitrate/isopropylmalate dehydrogenase
MGIRADALASIDRILNADAEGFEDRKTKLVKVIRKANKNGTLDVYFDRAADAVRYRDEEGVDWANMLADSLKFRFAVSDEVTSMLYETSE